MSNERRVYNKKLLVILHKACSEIRSLVKRGEYGQVYDLADTVEFIPELMLHWRRENEDSIQTALKLYQNKYFGKCFDYLSILEMNEVYFTEIYINIDIIDYTTN